MSEENQIRELANDYYEAMLKARGTIGSMNNGAPEWYAKHLYEKGWRKQTVDVDTSKIFEELETVLHRRVHPTRNEAGEIIPEYDDGLYIHLEDYHTIKKRYLKENPDGRT